MKCTLELKLIKLIFFKKILIYFSILFVLAKKNNTSLVRNIWVSGLSSITKATDLKQLFSKYGKVMLLNNR